MKTKHICACLLLLTALFTSSCYGHRHIHKERPSRSTISVVGTGTVFVQPDMIQMSVTLSNVSQTTKMASDEVSKMVKQALAILKAEKIEDKFISTASLTFHSAYEYKNHEQVLTGQRAEQSITFSIENIKSDNEKVSRIIDQLIQIDGIALNQVSFSVKDNTPHFIKSRELAFQKALEKATQYAELSNSKIKKVLSISEEWTQNMLPINNRLSNRQVAYEDAGASASDAGSTVVPAGELEITTRISVVFSLE